MRSVTDSIRSTASGSPRIGPRRSEGQRHTPTAMETSPRSSGCTAVMARTTKWTHRAIACFDQALEDVGLTASLPLLQVLHDYFAWATNTTMSRYHESADDVPAGMRIPQWSWDGLQG